MAMPSSVLPLTIRIHNDNVPLKKKNGPDNPALKELFSKISQIVKDFLSNLDKKRNIKNSEPEPWIPVDNKNSIDLFSTRTVIDRNSILVVNFENCKDQNDNFKCWRSVVASEASKTRKIRRFIEKYGTIRNFTKRIYKKMVKINSLNSVQYFQLLRKRNFCNLPENVTEQLINNNLLDKKDNNRKHSNLQKVDGILEEIKSSDNLINLQKTIKVVNEEINNKHTENLSSSVKEKENIHCKSLEISVNDSALENSKDFKNSNSQHVIESVSESIHVKNAAILIDLPNTNEEIKEFVNTENSEVKNICDNGEKRVNLISLEISECNVIVADKDLEYCKSQEANNDKSEKYDNLNELRNTIEQLKKPIMDKNPEMIKSLDCRVETTDTKSLEMSQLNNNSKTKKNLNSIEIIEDILSDNLNVSQKSHEEPKEPVIVENSKILTDSFKTRENVNKRIDVENNEIMDPKSLEISQFNINDIENTEVIYSKSLVISQFNMIDSITEQMNVNLSGLNESQKSLEKLKEPMNVENSKIVKPCVSGQEILDSNSIEISKLCIVPGNSRAVNYRIAKELIDRTWESSNNLTESNREVESENSKILTDSLKTSEDAKILNNVENHEIMEPKSLEISQFNINDNENTEVIDSKSLVNPQLNMIDSIAKEIDVNLSELNKSQKSLEKLKELLNVENSKIDIPCVSGQETLDAKSIEISNLTIVSSNSRALNYRIAQELIDRIWGNANNLTESNIEIESENSEILKSCDNVLEDSDSKIIVLPKLNEKVVKHRCMEVIDGVSKEAELKYFDNLRKTKEKDLRHDVNCLKDQKVIEIPQTNNFPKRSEDISPQTNPDLSNHLKNEVASKSVDLGKKNKGVEHLYVFPCKITKCSHFQKADEKLKYHEIFNSLEDINSNDTQMSEGAKIGESQPPTQTFSLLRKLRVVINRDKQLDQLAKRLKVKNQTQNLDINMNCKSNRKRLSSPNPDEKGKAKKMKGTDLEQNKIKACSVILRPLKLTTVLLEQAQRYSKMSNLIDASSEDNKCSNTVLNKIKPELNMPEKIAVSLSKKSISQITKKLKLNESEISPEQIEKNNKISIVKEQKKSIHTPTSSQEKMLVSSSSIPSTTKHSQLSLKPKEADLLPPSSVNLKKSIVQTSALSKDKQMKDAPNMTLKTTVPLFNKTTKSDIQKSTKSSKLEVNVVKGIIPSPPKNVTDQTKEKSNTGNIIRESNKTKKSEIPENKKKTELEFTRNNKKPTVMKAISKDKSIQITPRCDKGENKNEENKCNKGKQCKTTENLKSTGSGLIPKSKETSEIRESIVESSAQQPTVQNSFLKKYTIPKKSESVPQKEIRCQITTPDKNNKTPTIVEKKEITPPSSQKKKITAPNPINKVNLLNTESENNNSQNSSNKESVTINSEKKVILVPNKKPISSISPKEKITAPKQIINPPVTSNVPIKNTTATISKDKIISCNESKNEGQWGKPNEDYHFVSRDAAENADNFHAGWNKVRNVSSVCERYRAIRELWRNLAIPDPSRNLTFRYLHNNAENPCRNNKMVPNRRQRSLSCSSVYEIMIEKAQLDARTAFLELDYQHNEDINKMATYYRQIANFHLPGMLIEEHNRDVQVLHIQHEERKWQIQMNLQNEIQNLEDYIREIRTFHSFYQGLDEHDTSNKLTLTPEQVDVIEDTSKIYEAYTKIYHPKRR